MVSTLALGLTLLAAQDPPQTFPVKRLELGSHKTLQGGEIAIPAQDAKATVIMFVSAECPIANRYTPEVLRIQEEFEPNGVVFVRAYIDVTADREELTAHAKDFGLKMPALVDSEFRLVKAIGATVTPEVAVISSDSHLLYRGRIDDQYLEHGRVSEPGYRRDLRIALAEILAGQPVSQKTNIPWGCYIPIDP